MAEPTHALRACQLAARFACQHFSFWRMVGANFMDAGKDEW